MGSWMNQVLSCHFWLKSLHRNTKLSYGGQIPSPCILSPEKLLSCIMKVGAFDTSTKTMHRKNPHHHYRLASMSTPHIITTILLALWNTTSSISSSWLWTSEFFAIFSVYIIAQVIFWNMMSEKVFHELVVYLALRAHNFVFISVCHHAKECCNLVCRSYPNISRYVNSRVLFFILISALKESCSRVTWRNRAQSREYFLSGL